MCWIFANDSNGSNHACEYTGVIYGSHLTMVSIDGYNPVLDRAEIVLNTSGQKEILKDRYKLVFNYVFINKSVLKL